MAASKGSGAGFGGVTTTVYVVGRMLNSSGVYDGPVQDSGVFTGSVLLR